MDRRTLLQGVVAMPATSCVIATPARATNPDAGLIALCQELQGLRAEADACTLPVGPERSAFAERNDNRFQAAMAEAAALPARTMEGLRARAAVLREDLEDLNRLSFVVDAPEAAMVAALVADLLGGQA